MTDSLRGRNLVALYMFIDTNTLIGALHRGDEVAQELFRLWEAGWIGLARTDTMNTERFQGQDEETQALREAESADLPEALGPLVLDHSRLDHAVLASPEDEQRLQDAFAILFPSKSWETVGKNSRRDSMHVATAARYGGRAFITNEIGLLRKDAQIAAKLGIRIWSPAQALAEAQGGIEALRKLHRLEPDRGPLPTYPAPWAEGARHSNE